MVFKLNTNYLQDSSINFLTRIIVDSRASLSALLSSLSSDSQDLLVPGGLLFPLENGARRFTCVENLYLESQDHEWSI
jgi:hypothetical protein